MDMAYQTHQCMSIVARVLFSPDAQDMHQEGTECL